MTLSSSGGHVARRRRLAARRGGEPADAFQKLAHAEIVERAAEEDRGHVAFAIGLDVEGRAQLADHGHLVLQLLPLVTGQVLADGRVVEAADRERNVVDARPVAAIHQHHAVVEHVIAAAEMAAHADRPGGRGHVQRQGLFDLVDQLQRVAGLAVHLVDEGDDRHVAQAADLEQLAGLFLDTLRGVDDHDRAVDRGQRAVGVFREILVARRVEQVEGEAVMLEAHHRGRHRNAALALHLQPVRARTPLLAARLHRTGHLDGAGEQQQLLGQRGLAGVGMRDDREGAATRDLGADVGDVGHALGRVRRKGRGWFLGAIGSASRRDFPGTSVGSGGIIGQASPAADATAVPRPRRLTDGKPPFRKQQAEGERTEGGARGSS